MMRLNNADIDAANNNSAPDGHSESCSRIGELSKAFGISLRALRFYEDKGLIAPLRSGTTRLYTKRDVARLKLIILGRKVGFSLREVKQILDLYDPGSSNIKQLKVALEKSEKQLVKLQKQRTSLDEAIDELGKLIESVRARLSDRRTEKAASKRG